MKYQESFTGLKSDFADFVKKAVPELFTGKLAVEGRKVSIPKDANLDYKVKYDDDEEGGSFTIKVSWDNETESDEQDEFDNF